MIPPMTTKVFPKGFKEKFSITSATAVQSAFSSRGSERAALDWQS
jgi:hypothetical protein